MCAISADAIKLHAGPAAAVKWLRRAEVPREAVVPASGGEPAGRLADLARAEIELLAAVAV